MKPEQSNRVDTAASYQSKALLDSQSPTQLIQTQIVRQLQLEVEKVIICLEVKFLAIWN